MIIGAKINQLAFVDIMNVAWKKLLAQDLVNTRFAAKEREKRKQNIREEVYNQVKGNIAAGSNTDNTVQAMDQLGYCD